MKPYCETELGKLYHGDCLEIMPMLEPVDLVLTDPPYGTTACKWDSIIPLDLMWVQLKRVIKKNGSVVLFGSQPFTTILISSNMEMFKYCWVWNKIMGGNIFNAKLAPLKTHEDVCIFSHGKTANCNKNNMVYNPQMENADIKNIRPVNMGSKIGKAIYDDRKKQNIARSDRNYNPKKRYPKSIINISKYADTANSTKRQHPTQKPEGLMEYLIKTYTNENETVLDFCLGSGTTAIACERLNRKWIGIEIEEKYCEIAAKRIDKERQQLKLFN